MRTGFICPNGSTVTFDQCMARCPWGDRCLTKSTLFHLSKVRPWTGKPSTTQLVNPTRIEYLKLTHDYQTRPRDMAFALLGTRVHLGLADADTDVSILEARLEDEFTSGTPDCYELEPGTDGGVLTDYKTWGSYRVARALGIVKVRTPDPTGAVYKRSGNGYRAGDPKMVNRFERDPNAAKNDDVEWQLNDYRLRFEAQGFAVARLQVEAIVRDGGTQTARNRGVTDLIYLIPVRILPDHMVRDYFEEKRAALLHHLDTKTLPPECTDDECWEGRRCRYYCDVWTYCPRGQQEHAALAPQEEGEEAT